MDMEMSLLFPSPCPLKTLHYTYSIYLFLAASQKKKKNTPPCILDYVVIRSGSTPGLLGFWGKMTTFWMVCRAGRRGGPPGDYDTAQVSLPLLNFTATRKKRVHRVGFVHMQNTRSPRLLPLMRSWCGTTVSNAGKAETPSQPGAPAAGWAWGDLGAFLLHWHYLWMPARV